MSVVYNVTFTPVVGSMGTLVEYKAVGDPDWIVPDTPANPTTLATYPLSLEILTDYYVRVSAICSGTPKYRMILVSVGDAGPCCPDGYTLSMDSTYCYQESVLEPTILQSDICLAPAPLASQYSGAGTYIYDVGYTTQLFGGRTLLTDQPLWEEVPLDEVGPMNRDAVWVDTDCDGNKDALTAGQELQITYLLTLAEAATMYVGIGGDNAFKLELNGDIIVNCTLASPAGGGSAGDNFNFWHLFPVDLVAGDNYFTFSGVGDGTTNDSFAAVIYDNTEAELLAATVEGDLTIVFRTSDLIGDHIDIATCPSEFFLDTTGGQGNYICRQILTTDTISC